MYTFKAVKRDIKVKSFVASLNDIKPKGFDFSGEIHDFWELVYVKIGCVVATADDRVHEITAGQLLFHKPLEFHSIKSAYDSSPHLLNISFTASGDRMKKFENKLLELNAEQQQQYEKINQKITAVIELYNQEKQLSDEYIYESTDAAVMLENLLIELSNNHQTVKRKITQNEKLFSRIISVLDENCVSNLSVDDIASICNMSVSNLKRIFALYSDIGIAKYFLKIKLRRAFELIVDGVSAAEISKMLNFSSTAYFNTVLKREMGLTPAQYRNVRR